MATGAQKASIRKNANGATHWLFGTPFPFIEDR
jgi:hypothetical protein